MTEENDAPASPPASGGNPKARANGKTDRKDRRVWQNAGGEADLLWNEILEWDREQELPLGPGGFNIHVQRTNPSPSSLGNFGGECAAPDPDNLATAGQLLREYVIDNFHRAPGGSAAKYQIRFNIKRLGGTLTQASLNLPSQTEIMAMRQPQYPNPYATMGAPPPRYPPPQPHYPWPQQQQPPAPPPPPAPAPTLAAPQAPMVLPAGTDPAVVALMTAMQQQLAYLSGQLQQQQPPQPAPAPQMPAFMGAPPAAPQPQSADAVAMSVLEKLVAWGVIKKPGETPATIAAPQATPQQAVSQVDGSLRVLREFLGQMRDFKNIGSEVSEVFRDDDKEEPPKPEEAKKPEDQLPWQRVALGDGGVWALDKETGGPSWHGIVAEMMNKPEVREKVLDLAGRALDLGKEFMGRTRGPIPSTVGQPQPPQQLPAAAPQGPQQGGGWGV